MFRLHSTWRSVRGVTHRLIAITAAAIATVIVQSARAAPFIQLDWRSPNECLMAGAVEQSVQRLVKRPPLVSQVARVVIERSEPRWVATLDMQHGVRRLEGASCEELVETLAVVIALAIDSVQEPALAQAAAPEPQKAGDSTPPTETPATMAGSEAASNRTALGNPTRDAAKEREAVVVTVPPTKMERLNPPGRRAETNSVPDSVAGPYREHPTAPGERAETNSVPGYRRRRILLAGGVGAIGEWGALPSVAAAGSVVLRIAGDTWAARVRGASFFSQDATIGERPVGTISLRFGALEPCVAQPWLAKRWEFCAAFEYGSLSGSGRGMLSNGTGGTTYWYSLGGAVGTWFELLRYLQIEPRLGIAFPLFHPSFTMGEVNSVHRVGVASGRAELNLWLVY